MWLHGSGNSEYMQSRIQTNVAISDDAPHGTVIVLLFCSLILGDFLQVDFWSFEHYYSQN